MRLPRKYWLETLWAVFAAASVTSVFFLTEWETIPFHVVWVSLSLLCCFRLWSFWATAAVLAIVTAVSGAALTYVVASPAGPGWDELAEVPMMAAMWAVMVWGAWRAEAAKLEVQRSAERERDFVRDASHLLRTPITVAAGHAELIRESTVGTPVAEDVETVLAELKRLSAISDRLLTLHSVADPHFLARGPVDIGRLVGSTASRWAATTERDWKISVTAKGWVVGDEDRLTLALDCLIENALLATVPGDRISIACRTQGGTAIIEVSDSGRGIPEEDQARIFEPFARVHQTRAYGTSGTGLGLTIVKAMTEAHHGSVEVESEPGSGATFRVCLGGFQPDRQSVEFASNGVRSPSSDGVLDRAAVAVRSRAS